MMNKGVDMCGRTHKHLYDNGERVSYATNSYYQRRNYVQGIEYFTRERVIDVLRNMMKVKSPGRQQPIQSTQQACKGTHVK